MLFNSLTFAIFFLLLCTVHFSIPHRFRWIVMLAASYYFYLCWSPQYLPLILASTLITWYAGLKISALSTNADSGSNPGSASDSGEISGSGAENNSVLKNNSESSADIKRAPRLSESEKVVMKKRYVALSLAANLGALFFFKYFNFFTASLLEIAARMNLFHGQGGPLIHLMMPVGISFYTFQVVSYTVDVYSGRIPAERNLGIFALYVVFWPRLVAGPIERAGRLIPQFRKEVGFDYTRVTDGLRLILWGMIKKVVIADLLALYVNQVFDHCNEYSGLPLIIASIFFTIQIYCDFSGYSDMAIGSARVMGYELMDNFRHPYSASSLREFWQRWHISLSTWFRDYVYIPMGGNRVVKWRFYYNLFITFLVSGLWHGANWTFVIWGGLHGIYLIVEHMVESILGRIMAATTGKAEVSSASSGWFRIVLTFLLVNYAWIYFRANHVADAFSITAKMFMFKGTNPAQPVVAPSIFILSIFLIISLFIVEMKDRKVRLEHYIATLSLKARWSIYTLALWAVIMATVFGVKQEFIYFQF